MAMSGPAARCSIRITGKIYRATIVLEDGGNKLRLHGYIGISLLGRTQYWLREH